IVNLPDGYDTFVGEHGLSLSGGERQRIALARALLKDAPLLLLDEPTANLDPANARAIMETLWAASAGRSVLLITHDLAGLDAVDAVLVLAEGRFVQRGTHAALLAQDGLYRRLWQAGSPLLATE
ncbi:MAG: ATP-binding cassette domain-containing protein, partial [Anaerolineae bacterium]|nr:ATP-binding cassette domain-containing protein [Anaerolineae bacterium]